MPLKPWRLAVLLCALGAASAYAEAPRQIAWEELKGRPSDADNPIAKLSYEQLEALVDVAAVRDRKAVGVGVSAREVLTERAAAAKLEQAGIDVEALLARRSDLDEKHLALAKAVNPALDGKLVRLPGYLLPIEFSGHHVTEFLLVPWVGACSHTPPPPPNQIVHVKADKPIEVWSMFGSVWVTGRMATGVSRKSVYIVDGSADIEVGYSIRAGEVERYTK